MKKKYTYSVLGGTFDHLHVGHEKLLREAGTSSKHLLIGVTTDEMARATKLYPQSLEMQAERMKAVKLFCRNQGFNFSIVSLTNAIGDAGKRHELQTLFYTEEVKKGAEAVNIYRLSRGLPALLLIEVPLLFAEDNRKLSSELIRAGELDRYGHVYLQALTSTIVLKESQRQQLQKPLGPLVNSPDKSNTALTFVVGDSTLEEFQKNNWPFDMAIIDGKKQRTYYSPLVIDPSVIDLVVINRANTVSTMLVQGLALAIRQNLNYVYVDGEEDLAAIALQLLAPLESTIYYGQWQEGLVKWRVTESSKNFAYQLLRD